MDLPNEGPINVATSTVLAQREVLCSVIVVRYSCHFTITHPTFYTFLGNHSHITVEGTS